MDNDAGGGGGNPYAPAFTDVEVVPEDLAHFARLVQSDLGAIQAAWNNLRTDMENGENPNFPGGHGNDVSYANGYPEVLDNASPGIYEGQEFNRAYFLTLGAERMLMDDVVKGHEILYQAATMIHNDYLATDAGSAGGLEGAFAAYEETSVIDALDRAATPPEQGGASI
jgi:asparagine N-glycosylation enzyme membrane subunit Stt3